MEHNGNTGAKLRVIISMAIFGTIGIFRRYIPLGSATLAMFRGLIGMAALLAAMAIQKKHLAWGSIRRSGGLLAVSGLMLGLNWILLFEAYNYTTVATATLCYYMAPIFVILASPVLLHERLRPAKLICVLAALGGMVLVSGVLSGGGDGGFRGIALGLSAAVFYAGVVLTNRWIRDIPAYDRTVSQLFVSTVLLLPYVLAREPLSAAVYTPAVLGLLAVVGIVHTGLAYALYFGAMEFVPAQTVALFSYIDPIVAVALSACFLREPLGPLEIVGALCVLGATAASELLDRRTGESAPE